MIFVHRLHFIFRVVTVDSKRYYQWYDNAGKLTAMLIGLKNCWSLKDERNQ